MTPAEPLSVVLAGGGSAGHVNPLLATADALRRRDPATVVTVLGTSSGLEARLVPERGYDLQLLPRAPFPRRPDTAALRFPGSVRGAVRAAGRVLADRGAHALVGFGGYVAGPAYLAARRQGVPIVVHEQNARPGLANRLGARLTPWVATTFPGTALPHARQVGLPLRQQISRLDRAAARAEALARYGLREDHVTLLVFGGSLGAQRLNESVAAAASALTGAGVQVLHLTGGSKAVRLPPDGAVAYRAQEYTDRMDLAYAVADLALCRAGAGTVCELTAVGVPAVYVPLPVGNGEQRLNAREVVQRGGGLLVEDGSVTPGWVREVLVPLLLDRDRLAQLAGQAAALGQRDADEALVDLVLEAVGRREQGTR